MLSRRLRRSSNRGYTLMELLAVVAIVGIMAALAIASYRQWMASARTGETKDLLQTIAQGQHMYRQDTGGYLGCSDDWTDWYPIVAGPTDKKHLFHNSLHPDYPCWRLLAPNSSDPTYVTFNVRAGTASDTPPAPPLAQTVTWPAVTEPWYIAHAAADQDADSTQAHWVLSSFQPGNVLVENESE